MNDSHISRVLRVALPVVALFSFVFSAGCTPERTYTRATTFPSLVLPALGPELAPVSVPKLSISACPRIFSRADWASAAPIAGRLTPMGAITRLTIHHEGMGTSEETSVENVKAELRIIQKSHQGYRRWGDIGYHYIIDCSGRVWEGRPIEYQGAHAGNSAANKGNIGIVVMGNFEIQKPNAAELDSLERLVNHLLGKYDIPLSKVYTHREVYALHGLGATDCPGKYLQRKVATMRIRLAAVRDAAK